VKNESAGKGLCMQATKNADDNSVEWSTCVSAKPVQSGQEPSKLKNFHQLTSAK